MNINDCYVIEIENDRIKFQDEVKFAMDKGYSVSSTNIVPYQNFGDTKVKYIAVMIKNKEND